MDRKVLLTMELIGDEMSEDMKITIEIGPDLLAAIEATLKANKEWNEMICPYIRWYDDGFCAPKPQSPGRAIQKAFGIDITKLQKNIIGE